jgi:hypothetical protein
LRPSHPGLIFIRKCIHVMSKISRFLEFFEKFVEYFAGFTPYAFT